MTTEPIKHKNIHEAIHAIYEDVSYVQKEGQVAFGNTKYKYAGEASFIDAIRPAMVKHGVTISVSKTKLAYVAPGHVIINCTYHFSHKDTQAAMVVQSLGEGKDTGDKAVPKALTGAFKYALRQTFMISTGDDPDKVSSEELLVIEEKQKEASAKKRGDAIMKEMNGLRDNEDLDNFQVAYKADINAFRYGSKIEKEFYDEIVKEGARLRGLFKEMAK